MLYPQKQLTNVYKCYEKTQVKCNTIPDTGQWKNIYYIDYLDP